MGVTSSTRLQKLVGSLSLILMNKKELRHRSIHIIIQLLEPRDVSSIWPFVQKYLHAGFVQNKFQVSAK